MEQQNEYEWGESPEKTEAEIAEDIRKNGNQSKLIWFASLVSGSIF